ncbi:class I SAM-dependent DNA methyltransferase [Paracoccus sp. SM22M-07]|uniref:HsdM family class I SAM-dependent methyltransferase n=1 Tax=Paracoccus sp. SM22M-07 TaxID=1520813 RepID=UPI00091F60CD|nr:N-6 DNA methylase [Paracoccus sp. SM22M-07]OJH43089.1 restriction endonuclease subunit M [Paracoccus sp. SM22M-07]
MTGSFKIDFFEVLRQYGADEAALRLLDDDEPALLPYATLLSARNGGDEDLQAVSGIYEWQGTPLVFLVSADLLGEDDARLQRIRRLLAMRGDAPYLGVVGSGRLDIYNISFDDCRPAEARVDVNVPAGQEIATLAHLANVRPGLSARNRQRISQVVLKLLSGSIDTLKTICGVDDDDAISLVGRALFTRFLGDRHLLGSLGFDIRAVAALFDDAASAAKTSAWLDTTFNGDFLPTSQGIWERLPQDAFRVLGDILRRAPGGQLHLGWEERWDNLDFAHIPVGVLSQAYEHYLHEHTPDRQRREGGFYTPRPIADLMVRGGLNAVARTTPAQAARILDPAAGAGVFLITAFRQLVAENWRASGRRPNTIELRRILYDQITGFDINEAALRFAALGLYLMSIELDAHPEPVGKLKFENLRGRVLLKMSEDGQERSLGSLGPAVGDEHVGRYDLVVGNPPWATSTRLAAWNEAQAIIHRIAAERLPADYPPPPIPNEVLDLPFVWRAMEWAKPLGQIAFALHARLLFQQGDGMQSARRALFAALDVTGVINGVELRQTRVWPEIAAPFCILYARNQVPPQGAGCRLVSPRLEGALNQAGVMRIDATNAEFVTTQEVIESPEIFKLLFKGTRADIQVYERLQAHVPERLGEYWRRLFGAEAGRARFTGNGYQKLRNSSRIRKHGDGLPGVPANYLHGRREVTLASMTSILVDEDALPFFNEPRIHDRRAETLFDGPLVVVQEAPPVSLGRIRTAVVQGGAVFNTSLYGYSSPTHDDGLLVRYLSLVISSKIALWQVLITSGKFGFERDTVEKATIDRLFIPTLESLSDHNRSEVLRLFQLVQDGRPGAWDEVDRWCASIFHLRERDLQVVTDTLQFNLPFAENRRLAQSPVEDEAVNQFCKVLRAELSLWGQRLGRDIEALPAVKLETSPWRGIRITSSVAESKRQMVQHMDWAKFLPLADHFAATEVIFKETDNCLWLGRLDQARYWSETQARLVAQSLAWEHMDVLKGRASA